MKTGDSVTFSYGGLDYAATVTNVVDVGVVDLKADGADGTFERFGVPQATDTDRDGRWSEIVATAAVSKRSSR